MLQNSTVSSTVVAGSVTVPAGIQMDLVQNHNGVAQNPNAVNTFYYKW